MIIVNLRVLERAEGEIAYLYTSSLITYVDLRSLSMS